MKTKLTLVQRIGLVLLPVSMLIYYWVPQTQGTLSGWSLINYMIAAGYFFISFLDKPTDTSIFSLKRPRINWHILLALLLVSCFTLNKDIHVFALTPRWLELVLIPMLFAFVMLASPDTLPGWLRSGTAFFAGLCSIVLVYYALVLLPAILFAVIGLVLLGISIHLAVPLIMLITLLRFVIADKKQRINKPWFRTGFFSAFLVLGVYIGLYAYQSEQIVKAQEDIILSEERELPEWVQYAQRCNSPFWARRVIGLGLLYEKHSDDWWGFDFSRGSFSEIREHDPLVALAGLRVGQIDLSNEEKVKILSTSADTRHYAYEKLWSGRDLRISKKVTDMRVYPDCRLAYSEQTFWIENTHQFEGNRQEALLTFYLPEGAVASSLSLWIDGKEEKSRLTTRKKAATAYRQVVGVEQRDPVVLHWQEGNRLTATIFPCTPAEPRRVKIGITIPMKLRGEQLLLESMQIAGPDNTGAQELIHLKVVGQSEALHVPAGFELKTANQYLYKGRPLDHYQVSLSSQPLSQKHFVFNGNSFQLEAIQAMDYLNPKTIYLDVNSQWTEEELESIFMAAQDRPVYVFTNHFEQVELSTLDALYNQLSGRSFSLFPVHKVEDVASALLITKGQKNAPVPSELAPSVFYNDLKASIKNYRLSLACLVLDGHKSDYMASLEQYKLLDCQTISSDAIKKGSMDKWYRLFPQREGTVVLADSEMVIVKAAVNDEDKLNKGAPSHLLRLYNYHAIIQQAGHLFLNDEAEIDEQIYNWCDEAFVVSPVSSLIVLETQKDYDRFGIDESTDSVKNASLKDSGAVPEPHEWALIAVVFAVIVLMYFKFKV